MKLKLQIALLIVVLGLGACHDKDPVHLSVDELKDMEIYTQGFEIDASTYMGKTTVSLSMNHETREVDEVLDLRKAGFYWIELRVAGRPETHLIRVVVLAPGREETEWGLGKWTPRGLKVQSLAGEKLSVIAPSAVPRAVEFPVVVLIGEELLDSDKTVSARYGNGDFLLKQGVGSFQAIEGENELLVDGQALELAPGILDTEVIRLSGTLESDLEIAAGSHVIIEEDLHIPEGLSLRFAAGSYVEVHEAVNIHNRGLVEILGSEKDPVCINASQADSYWGGFISRGPGSRVYGRYALISRSGYHDSGEFSKLGHARRQALFQSEEGSMSLDHVYMVDHIGQIFHPESSILEISNCLVQRVKTGGQINRSVLSLDSSVFTDFPDDRLVFADDDNDGLYINRTDAVISNCLFMFAKDDGLDSGAAGGGTVEVRNCRFQSCFHEGAALSSGGDISKDHLFVSCEFVDCGQGLELGYSSPNHRVVADSCRFEGNGIGIRFGDCYPNQTEGHILVRNSLSINNRDHDVWNMKRIDWLPALDHMQFEDLLISIPSYQYPELARYE